MFFTAYCLSVPLFCVFVLTKINIEQWENNIESPKKNIELDTIRILLLKKQYWIAKKLYWFVLKQYWIIYKTDQFFLKVILNRPKTILNCAKTILKNRGVDMFINGTYLSSRLCNIDFSVYWTVSGHILYVARLSGSSFRFMLYFLGQCCTLSRHLKKLSLQCDKYMSFVGHEK